MKKFTFLTIAATFAAATAFTGCTDEIIQPEPTVKGGELLSRGAYDYPAVEWDNVTGLKVASNSYKETTEIPLPWEPGSGHSAGIPEKWIDHNLRDPDAKKRAYSKVNGWNMVFHNLSDPLQNNKYFGLYNKFSGTLRLFFYSMAPSVGMGSSGTWGGLRVSGSTSLLNFTGRYPLAMSDRQQNPMFFASPECEISNSSMKQQGYESENWYVIEVEVAYDANATSANLLSARLWAQYLTSITMTGSSEGKISGSVETVYSNSPSNMSVSLTANIANTTINNGEKVAKEELQAKAAKGGNFFTNLWNNIKGQIPELAGKAAKEGIEALFSKGTSLITKGLSKLLGMSGRSASPMTSTSKVDLGLTSTLDLTGSEQTNVVGWGSISSFNLPQFEANNKVYTGKLGVWNLQDYPKVTVDLLMTSMYYPKELVPNPVRPQACYPIYSYTLSKATLVVNPELLTDYKVENQTQQLVFTSAAGVSLGTPDTGTAYGLNGSTEFYRPSGSSAFKVTGMTMSPFGNWNASDPETSYSRFWNGYESPVTGKTVMCHVYFELVSKTNSNERYAYSKYFPCTPVKGKFTHREETITQ